MVSHISSVAFSGIEAVQVDVQAHLSPGLPAFTIVGLPDKSVAESKERVRAALHSLGLSLPAKRITINLAPADLQKEGGHFDLPIALGLLVAMDVIAQDAVDNYTALGELSLDGTLQPVAGVLPAAISATAIGRGLICPKTNGSEAKWAGDIDILAAENLLSLINHFKGVALIDPPAPPEHVVPNSTLDLKDIRGQKHARRALEIAAAGGHNLLMLGPPGSGKSMLAARLPSILPPLQADEILEVSMIQSIAGLLMNGRLSGERPFRDPHHNCSMPAMIGGGAKAKPGEITLAHRGVLFLDELPEFPRQVLESLRQPLETRKVTVSRVASHITYPSHFQLVAAMNPCKCGYLGDPNRACTRAPKCGAEYQSKLSGPLLDRIDLHVEVSEVKPSDILESDSSQNESSTIVRTRVSDARARQQTRYKAYPIRTNAEADGDILYQTSAMEEDAKTLLHQAMERFGLSMRSYNRVIRVARTIADLEASVNVKRSHIAEALSFRLISYRESVMESA